MIATIISQNVENCNGDDDTHDHHRHYHRKKVHYDYLAIIELGDYDYGNQHHHHHQIHHGSLQIVSRVSFHFVSVWLLI